MKKRNEMWFRISRKISTERQEKKATNQRIIVVAIWILCLLVISQMTDGNSTTGALTMVAITIGLIIIMVILPFGKISEPTDEEIKDLAKKELNESTVKRSALEKEIPELEEIIGK